MSPGPHCRGGQLPLPWSQPGEQPDTWHKSWSWCSTKDQAVPSNQVFLLLEHEAKVGTELHCYPQKLSPQLDSLLLSVHKAYYILHTDSLWTQTFIRSRQKLVYNSWEKNAGSSFLFLRVFVHIFSADYMMLLVWLNVRYRAHLGAISLSLCPLLAINTYNPRFSHILEDSLMNT